MCAHPLFGRAEQVNCHQPSVERDVRILEDRAHPHCELFPASPALPHASADVRFSILSWLEPVGLALYATMRADRPFRPALRFQKRAGLIFVAEVLCYVVQVHGILPSMMEVCQNHLGLSSI